jgi:hypothetical protein
VRRAEAPAEVPEPAGAGRPEVRGGAEIEEITMGIVTA